MLELASGWMIEAERGPNCLFVRLSGPDDLRIDGNELADGVWEVLQQHFTYRLVLELDDLTVLCSSIVGQLILLQKRIEEQNGLMRITGLSERCRDVLRVSRLEGCLAHYRDREEALMGHRPPRPK